MWFWANLTGWDLMIISVYEMHRIRWKHLQIEIVLLNLTILFLLSKKTVTETLCVCMCVRCWLTIKPPPVLIVAPPSFPDIVIKEMRVIEHLAACWGINYASVRNPNHFHPPQDPPPPPHTHTLHPHASPLFQPNPVLKSGTNLEASRQVLRLNISPKSHFANWLSDCSALVGLVLAGHESFIQTFLFIFLLLMQLSAPQLIIFSIF